MPLPCPFPSRWSLWLGKHRARLVNLYLFFNIVGYVAWQTVGPNAKGPLGFTEISFIAQNLVLAGVILLRRDHFALDTHLGHQAVALGAFFSGITFIGQVETGDSSAHFISAIVTIISNLLGAATLCNLGKSFGILIACRGVKASGLYRVVRHPMYLSDILLRVGYTVSHLTPLTVSLSILSAGLYVYRAILEERFLSLQPDYREYMDTVRYRFIPGVF